ncbi:AAA family ATPase [Haloflavibacter putidus]|uniref:AAA family ATPase n=1 Tax=Haloflavibacter putidus TaxID=2576776 RepID=A0A507ZR47_9FLAO|nr:AAA family ATPase [Haloflavibacter putidus]TQD39003.1 AAA family ATPase [Haloflavibacter putidus]
MENFITNIKINYSRNIKDFNIPLSKEKRQHLILTGKNGSGKTSLLLELNKYLTQIDNGSFQSWDAQNQSLSFSKNRIKALTDKKQIAQTENTIRHLENWFNQFGGTEIQFSNETMEIHNQCQKGEFLLSFFDSKRLSNLNIPQGIKKLDLKKKYRIQDKVNTNFIQYLVNLKADRSFARDDDEIETVNKIDDWFKRFEERLKNIFDFDSLKLKFDRKSYNFEIITNEIEPFNFNNLSDGYSAIISIVSELILRMEAHNVKTYDLEGIVIIDEIETHLHVDLQKKILPFLTDFFPRIQFIVTTHSPFVLSSISNATICDLETKIVTTDLSNYSYDALIESYFKTDKYSDEIKIKIKEFEKLVEKDDLTPEQRKNLIDLRNYFAHSPKYLSNELLVKLQELSLKELTKKKKEE